jgi:signal transduction histidine kinase
MPGPWTARLKELFSPLSLAAYAAWGAVWLATSSVADGAVPEALVRASLLLFLAVFAFEHLVSDPRRQKTAALAGAVLTVLAFIAIAGSPQGPAPILLILLASMLAAHFDWKPLLAALAVINAVFVAVVLMFWTLTPRSLIVYVLAYTSFQVFAAMVMRAAAHAEAMSERWRASNADLLATRELLTASTRDAERLRVARELHDIAGHKLTALKLNLAVLMRDPRFTDAAQPRLCATLADELLADLRGLVERMREDEGLDLGAAMRALASPFPRPRTHIEIAPDARVASVAQAEVVLRAVQEALTNSARHSQAQNLWVVLQREPRRLLLDIRDDGRGNGALVPGSGLAGMRERIEGHGGGLDVERLATGAVHLQAWLPMPA